jgi:hypothetical protein
MAYVEGGIVHRYLGNGKPCIEVKVIKIYPDSRCMLEDGSVINRFTKSYYHDGPSCPVPKLSIIDKSGTVKVVFPTPIETRRNPSKSKPDKEPYFTQKLSNGTYTCNCPWRTYHPVDDCTHIKEWKREDGVPVIG